jgi:hypothetical protein
VQPLSLSKKTQEEFQENRGVSCSHLLRQLPCCEIREEKKEKKKRKKYADRKGVGLFTFSIFKSLTTVLSEIEQSILSTE